MGKIAIYGFGRVGRCATRAALQGSLTAPSVISDVQDPDTLAALFAVDTNYGLWNEPVGFADGKLAIGERRISYVDARKSVPNWADLGVDVVIDCTGRGATRAGAQEHLDCGAKKVLVSAPSKSIEDCDAVLLRGINLDTYDPEQHHIISMASCTTNGLAPLVKVIIENFGIHSGYFSTVHAYTNSQALADEPKKSRRDSWAAAENIIPASSGAAKALLFIWPDLAVTGKAYRVPVSTGSIVELNVLTEKETTEDEVNACFTAAAGEPPLSGVMGVLNEEYVSCRVVGESLSSLVDLPLTKVLKGKTLSVAAWYDNEMGYATRLAETANEIALKL